MRHRAIALIIAATSVTLSAQGLPSFDVASIKPFSGSGPGMMHLAPDGGVTATGVSMRIFIGMAYPVESDQYIALPDWALSATYSVAVKPPAGATREQLADMWKALLRDRLELAAHYEQREEPVYNLVLARADRRLGPHLKPASLDCTVEAGPVRAPNTPPPILSREEALKRCGYVWSPTSISSGGMTIGALAAQLRLMAGRPVFDRTGLDGYYEVDLDYAPQPGAAPNDAVPLVTLLGDQLGLKLEPEKAPIDVVVIDHIERPTDN